MLSNYLKELIESNNRIIIPDFGAFMIQDSPEGKQISFNDFLKFNDGLLVNQIIKSEKISKNQASDMIKDFIKEVEKSFSNNIPFEIAGIGFLTKDSQGNIKFETKITSADKPKVSSTDEKPIIVLDEIPVAEEDKKEPTIVKEEVKESKPTEPKTPQKTPIVYSKAEQPPKTTIPPVSPTVKESKPFVRKPTETPKKMKSNTIKIVLISFLALIIIGGVVIVFIYFGISSKIISFITSKKKAPVEMVAVDSLSSSDSIMMQSAKIDSSEVEEPTIIEEPTEIIDAKSKKYYIVAGSFKVPRNAERFNKKLTEEGYASEIIMRKNGFHLVSYKMVSTRKEAQDEWTKLREINPQTWIFVK